MRKFNSLQFIGEVQKRPAIWDASCEEHGNRDIRKQCWKQIVDIFADKNSTKAERRYLSVDLQKRWKNIRTCYARELKRQKQLEAGIPIESDRKSEYIYWKQLQFLQKKSHDTGTPEIKKKCVEEHFIEIEEHPQRTIKLENEQTASYPCTSGYTEQRSMDHESTSAEANEDNRQTDSAPFHSVTKQRNIDHEPTSSKANEVTNQKELHPFPSVYTKQRNIDHEPTSSKANEVTNQKELHPFPSVYTKQRNIDHEPTSSKANEATKQKELHHFPSVYTKQRSTDHECTLAEAEEDKMFLMSLLGTLNSLPSRKKMNTKIKIMSVLHEAMQD